MNLLEGKKVNVFNLCSVLMGYVEQLSQRHSVEYAHLGRSKTLVGKKYYATKPIPQRKP